MSERAILALQQYMALRSFEYIKDAARPDDETAAIAFLLEDCLHFLYQTTDRSPTDAGEFMYARLNEAVKDFKESLE